MKDMLSENTFF